MKRIAIVPGSFDPATLGHRDIIQRASALFDQVYAVVMVNGAKESGGMFSPEQRLEILRSICRDIPRVECRICRGLASDFAKEVGATFFVKGVRNGTDYDYEYSLAQIMRHFDPILETVLLPSMPELAYISSTYARERLRYHSDLSDIADEATAVLMRRFLEER